jgi:hypothetical protein
VKSLTIAASLSLYVLCFLPGCFGHKVIRIHPTKATYEQYAAGAAKLSWVATLGTSASDAELTVVPSPGVRMEIFTYSNGNWLSYRCAKASKSACRELFVKLSETSGVSLP